MRANESLALMRLTKQDRRNEVGEALAHAGAGLDHAVFARLQRADHAGGHSLLRLAVFEVAGLRQESARPEDLPHLRL